MLCKAYTADGAFKTGQALLTHITTHEQVSFQMHQLEADRIRRTLTGETLTLVQSFKSP